MRPREKNLVKNISSERIAVLLSEAKKTFAENPARAQRYARLAFLIVRKNKVRLTKEQKLSFCRKCFSYWVPGKSASVSFDRKSRRVIYKCGSCGYERGIGYSRKTAPHKD